LGTALALGRQLAGHSRSRCAQRCNGRR
jgi:hypothetical protein